MTASPIKPAHPRIPSPPMMPPTINTIFRGEPFDGLRCLGFAAFLELPALGWWNAAAWEAVGPVVVTQGDRCLAALMMVSRKREDYQRVMHRLIDLLEVKLARPVVEGQGMVMGSAMQEPWHTWGI